MVAVYRTITGSFSETVTAAPAVPGFDTGTGEALAIAVARTDSDGRYQLELPPQDQVNPSGIYWTIYEPGGNRLVVLVPAGPPPGGAWLVDDIRVDDPEAPGTVVIQGVTEPILEAAIAAWLNPTDGDVTVIESSYTPDDPSKSLTIDHGASGGAQIATPGAVPALATTFIKDTTPDQGVSVGWMTTGGLLTHYYGTDNRVHTYEGTPSLFTGDSMLQVHLTAAKAKFAQATGRPIEDQATSGDQAQWIAAKVGAIPATVTVNDGRTGISPNSGTIPSTGSCSVTLATELGATTIDADANICGVRGVFTPTLKPVAPDPLAAQDPGSIGANYVEGTFRRRDQGGMVVTVPDGSPMLTGYNRNASRYVARMWPFVQPSRHNFFRRYERLPFGGTAGTVTLGLGVTGTTVGPISWDPTGASLGAVTFTASNDRVTFGSAHGLYIGAMVTFAGISGGGAQMVNGKVYTVRSVPTSTTVTLVGFLADGVTVGDLDISVDGTATGSTETPESVVAPRVAAAMATALGSGWTGTVNPITNTPGLPAPGVVEVDWGVADTPTLLVFLTSTGGATCTPAHLRTGIEDGLDVVEALLDMAGSDGRAHAIVLDIGPFPGEENGTAKRKLLDAFNAALAETFPREFFPVWALMRNAALITRVVAGTALQGVAPTAADLTAIQTTRMTPPTFTDTGGYTPSGQSSGGHPGDVGGDAWALLQIDRQSALPYPVYIEKVS